MTDQFERTVRIRDGKLPDSVIPDDVVRVVDGTMVDGQGDPIASLVTAQTGPHGVTLYADGTEL